MPASPRGGRRLKGIVGPVPASAPRPCALCGGPLPAGASSGRRWCDDCRGAASAGTRAEQKAARSSGRHIERHLVELVRFHPPEGRPYVLCTCEARLELPEDTKPGNGGFKSVPMSDMLGSRRPLPARFTALPAGGAS